MNDIQIQLVKVGLITGEKVKNINRQKAIDQAFIRIAEKAVPGASPKIWGRYADLKRRASRDLQLVY